MIVLYACSMPLLPHLGFFEPVPPLGTHNHWIRKTQPKGWRFRRTSQRSDRIRRKMGSTCLSRKILSVFYALSCFTAFGLQAGLRCPWVQQGRLFFQVPAMTTQTQTVLQE